MSFLTWDDEDSTSFLTRRPIKGINSINLMTSEEFHNYILYCTTLIGSENKIESGINGSNRIFNKYDINNGIISRMQSNEKLKADFYEILSIFRIEMFDHNKKEHTIDSQSLRYVLSDIFE